RVQPVVEAREQLVNERAQLAIEEVIAAVRPGANERWGADRGARRPVRVDPPGAQQVPVLRTVEGIDIAAGAGDLRGHLVDTPLRVPRPYQSRHARYDGRGEARTLPAPIAVEEHDAERSAREHEVSRCRD